MYPYHSENMFGIHFSNFLYIHKLPYYLIKNQFNKIQTNE